MKTLTVVCTLLLILLLQEGISWSDNAEVLPKGVWNANLQNKFYLPIGERYNPDGDVEDAAVDFNANLNKDAFPALGLIDLRFGFPLGYSTIGRSVVEFDYHVNITEFALNYGLTDRLTLGIFLPYWWVSNHVNARVDTLTATVGKNAFLNAILPLTIPGTVPLTTQDVKNLLGKGLDINNDGIIDIPGFKFKRFQSFAGEGISDLEVGLRYQYLKTDWWRLAFTGGVRFPTGEVDDPDNLTDLGRGDGVYGLLFNLNNDFTGIKNLVLNGTFRYFLLLPDEKTLRIPEDVNQPLTRLKEKVDRDMGDVIELEASAKYTFLKGLTGSALYKYGFKFKDDVTGPKGNTLPTLEAETNSTEHVYILGLSYSTVPLYQEKRFPVPFTTYIQYRDRFAGSNNVLKSKYIAFGLEVYF